MKSEQSRAVASGGTVGRAHLVRRAALVALTSLVTGVALAQVPPNIEAGLKKIGPIVDPACTADLYRPLMPKNDITSDAHPLYPGIAIARNQSFGANPDDAVDIFTADRGASSRPVLIYVPGGGGNKIETQDKAANAFYDNIGRWATQHGMVGVLMQRHRSPGWDGGAKDVSSMLQWVEAHIAQYHGNPERMFIWAHSAGNGPLGTYIGRPELYGPKGVGVIGVVFMSGAFDIAPVRPAAAFNAGTFRQMMANAGKTCHEPGGMASTAGVLPGVPAGHPGGPPEARAAGGQAGAAPARPRGGFGAAPDPAVQLAHSSLPALKTTSVKIMLANAGMDPGVNPSVNGGVSAFNKALHDTLCAEGPDHCPTMMVGKGESHMGEVFSIDTPDKTVSGPVLAFIHKTLRETH